MSAGDQTTQEDREDDTEILFEIDVGDDGDVGDDARTHADKSDADLSGSKNEDVYTFFISEDIYCYLILLLQRKNSQTKQSFLSELNVYNKWKLVIFCSLCFVVQMGGLLFFAITENYYSEEESEVVSYNCYQVEWDNGPAGETTDVWVATSNTTIPTGGKSGAIGEMCSTFSDNFFGRQEFDSKVLFAKLIAFCTLLIFISSDLLNIYRVIPLLNNAKACYIRFLWFMYIVYAVLLSVTLIMRIGLIVLSQDNIIDALTVGISFVILAELAHKMYETVATINPLLKYDEHSIGVSKARGGFGSKHGIPRHDQSLNLFEIKMSRKDLAGTIYEVRDPAVWDICTVCGLFLLCVWSTLYFGFIYPDPSDSDNDGRYHKYFETEALYLSVVIVTGIVPFALPLLYWFFKPVQNYLCKARD